MWSARDMRGNRLALKAGSPIAEKSGAERRRYRRVDVDLAGRLFIPIESREVTCRITDMSPGGASVECDVVPATGEAIILYVDTLGRFEGVVARHVEKGFGVRFSSTQLKRERTAEQLTMLMNKSFLDETDLRRDDRTPAKTLTRFTRYDGTLVDCAVIDLSTSGVSLKTETKPPVGEFVLIGQMAGRIARHHPEGIGIEFVGLGRVRPTADAIHAQIVKR